MTDNSQQLLETVCLEFESSLLEQPGRRLEDYLADPRLSDVVGHPQTTLKELLLIEFFWRQRREELVSEPEYLDRFPDYGDVVRAAVADHGQREQQRQSSGPSPQVRTGHSEKHLLSGRFQLKRLLGRGSFGEVYLYRDTLLGRDVALKTARRDQSATQATAGAIRTNRSQSLTEARKLSTLKIDGVPRVFDVFETEIDQQQTLCMTFEFIDGETLADQLAGRRTVPDYNATALQMAELASIVQQIHAHHMCHWDLKPSNIMVDKSGKLWIVDFGLAVFTSERHLHYGSSVGTTQYMSPEQVGAEPSRDGRSDIWSLGAIFYQLLTGKPPFSGGGAEVISHAIRNGALIPPRQIVPQTPPQLERICLKCLARDPLARYQSASELATELRNWHRVESESLALPVAAWRNVELPGLRAFGPKHKRLFLQLLPGIREENGLPQSINFWKQLAENRYESESAVPVALLTGVSGCGKSSLMKAGVLPVLERHVIPIYVEAAAEATEAALQRKLQERFPTLTQTGSLEELLRALRDGAFLSDDQKLLLVMDQFEQVLASENSADWCRMRDALRQCDGLRLQAVVMTRSDFQEAASLFFEGLGQKLNENTNSVTLRLFEPEHARHVLHLLGLALGRLPEQINAGSSQAQFLDEAIGGLSQNGRVNSVRLAVFAELLKNREWQPGTLRVIGGVRGVGVTFLEESFAVADAPLTHRRHLEAVRRVLKFLLPAVDSEIVGAVQSTSELRRVAGYDQRASDFESLIQILDTELRLITPIDLTKNSAATGETASDQRFYKLTHEFLVPSIREWIAKKQQQTRRGRAELALERRTELWSSRTEDRQLPSLWEYGQIRLSTEGRYWTQEQRQMMLVAGKRHRRRLLLGGTTLSALMCVLLFVWIKIAGDREQLRVDGLREQARKLAEAIPGRRTAELDAGLRELQPLQSYALPVLQEMSTKESSLDFDARLHLAIARLKLGDADEGLIQTVQQLTLQAAPEQLLPLTQLLQPWADQLAGEWRAIAGNVEEPVKRLHAACLLAGWEATARRGSAWSDPKTAEFVAAQLVLLVRQNPVFVGQYQEVLRPQAGRLAAPLAALFADSGQTEIARTIVTGLLADYAKDNVPVLAQTLLAADPVADKLLFPLLESDRARAITEFQSVLQQNLTTDWADPPLNPAWSEPSDTVKAQITAAHGVMTERSAFCLDMPLGELLEVVQALQSSGYRPVRMRPVVGTSEQSLRMSAVWVRDGGRFAVQPGVLLADLPQPDVNAVRDGLLLADLAFVPGSGPQAGWLTVWSEPSVAGEERRCLAGVSEAVFLQGVSQGAEGAAAAAPKFSQLTVSVHNDTAGQRLYSAIFSTQGYVSEALPSWPGHDRLDLVQKDVASAATGQPQLTDPRAGYRQQLEQIAALPAERREQREVRLIQATALYQTDQLEAALSELEWLTANLPTPNATVLQYRSVALARLQRQEDAAKVFAEFQQASPSASLSDYVAIQMLAAGKDPAVVIAALDAAATRHAGSVDDLYNIAGAAALSSGILRQLEIPDGAAQLREKALSLLTGCITGGYSDGQHLSSDVDFAELYADPRFFGLLSPLLPAERAAGLWQADPTVETMQLQAASAVDLQEQVGKWLSESWRPIAVHVDPVGGKRTAVLVLQRPLIADARKESLAIRQGAAAVALLRLGAASSVWPLLESRPDPRLRSEILYRLGLYGVDGRALLTQMQSESGSADTAVVSRRRSLIQGLGELAAANLLPPDLAREVTSDLLQRFTQDPDAGVHGMCEWSLRQLGASEQLLQAEQQFRTGEVTDGRRWYVTKTGGSGSSDRGLSFAIVDAREPFVMGSPLSEAERFDGPNGQNERRHRCRVGRVVAVGMHEVTVSQFLKFREEHDLNKVHSPTPDSPVNNVTWYDAAAYCNWLSEQENIAPSDWCYEAGAQGYAAGMLIKPNFAELQGYRLPTEAEWECVCRGETQTSRYFGETDRLLGVYAWYEKNSDRKLMQPVNALRPNCAGAFGMYGNAFEWCLDPPVLFVSAASISGDTGQGGEVSNERGRILRGGSFNVGGTGMRSAGRNFYQPNYRDLTFGFRVSRTYPLPP